MDIKIEGSDELEKKLEKIQQNVIAATSGEITIKKLISDSFMQKHSKFKTFEEFAHQFPTNENTPEECEEVMKTEEWNSWVKDNTQFKTWVDMLSSAYLHRIEQSMKSEI